eukprot:TRINITY_DN284_c0_g1_i3.p1 TRINITY_DN284_c0_g1~~TRINITY_DN284_c0_g1_i3.p1  ORF type:complete len:175 (-),score=25.56 TRINITY_DN284_c0_g1_i3:196-720(-)
MVEISLQAVTGEIIVTSTWLSSARVFELYKIAYGAKPGHQCKLLHGDVTLTPMLKMGDLDLRRGNILQVVWIANPPPRKRRMSFAFAAIKSNGSAVTWGNEDYGGDSSSVAGDLDEGVVHVTATGRAYAAIKSDGSVVTWGNSGAGGDSSSVAGHLEEGVVQVYATMSSPTAPW